MLRQVRQLSCLAALLLAGGCKRDAAPEAPAPAQGGKPYTVTASIAGPLARGATGALLAQVTASDGFHVNPDYPLSFRPEGSTEGVAFDRARFELKDGAKTIPCAKEPKDACALSAEVPFTASAMGKARAAGVLSFSVCDPNQCLIEKVPVAAELTVN